jgi:hypothetical protein
VATGGVREGAPRAGQGAHPSAARGSELCLAIVNPPRVRNHLSVGMWITALLHTKMVGEIAAL